MKLEIRKYGDPVLREKAEPVEKVDDRIRALAKNMIDTVHGDNGGVGLAAQQVGETVALCVVDVPAEYDADENGVRFNPDVKMPLVLINPEIIEASKETEVRDEGCLSFPGIYAPVRRPVEINLQFMDLNGKPQNLRLKRFCRPRRPARDGPPQRRPARRPHDQPQENRARRPAQAPEEGNAGRAGRGVIEPSPRPSPGGLIFTHRFLVHKGT